MIYKKEGRIYCTENCMFCDKDKKKCGARKERGRKINRLIYRAKKEYMKENKNEMQ